MLSVLQRRVEDFFESSAGIFRRIGFSPNLATMAGFLLSVATFVFYLEGLLSAWTKLGAILALLAGSYFDALDGALARRYSLTSKLGGILDSVLDRTGELFLYAGLAFGGLVSFPLALWAMSASFMVSYVRARAEVEGMVMKGVGLAERPERLLILIVATILQLVFPAALGWGTLVIAVLASVTVIQRVYRVSRDVSAARRS